MAKVRRILISQPALPENSPYHNLAKDVSIDCRSFVHVEGLETKDIRCHRIVWAAYSAIIMTSKNAVDFFFSMTNQMRYKVPDQVRYFCCSEAIANYLQKYVLYRKRRIVVGQRNITDLVRLMRPHKELNFLLPCSTNLSPSVAKVMNETGLSWKPIPLFKTIVSDLSDLQDVKYDMLVFFSPSGIRSLLQNFPNFEQGETRIAAHGASTIKTAKEAGLRVDVQPTEQHKTLSEAIKAYVIKANRKRRR